MLNTPILQISCQPARAVKVGNRERQGVLIRGDDIRLLRRLAGRDITIRVVCPGMRPYQANVKALLKRAVQVPGQQVWYVPTTLTGPLKPPAPPRLGEA